MLVVSYTAVSPLPPSRWDARASHRQSEAVCFLWHCPAGRPGWVLPTTLLCGVRTFLDAASAAAIAWPTRPVTSLMS